MKDNNEEENNEFKLLISEDDRDKDYNSYDNRITINNNNNNEQELEILNQDSFSKYRTQYWRTRLTPGIFAIVFLELIFFFGYFPYTIYYIQLLHNSFSFSNSVILFFFHFIFITTQICLFKTTFTDPGTIPNGFPDSEVYKDYNIQFTELNSTGEKRRCSKCTAYKPDRTHHCSRCKRCVLKMDHHCPFVNNCIGYFNYKFFVLFLIWTTVLCVYIIITTVDNFKQLLDVRHSQKPSIVLGIVFITALVFGVGMGFFALTHMKYIIYNETTIEHFEKNHPNSRRIQSKLNNDEGSSYSKLKNVYFIDYIENMKQVFGDDYSFMFLPYRYKITPISGLVFPTNQHNKKTFY